MPNLYLSNSPASYRIDLYRSLVQELDCVICFEEVREGVPGLNVCSWSLRSFPELIRQLRPRIVFVPEFSAAALVAIRLRKRMGFKVISFCDDSLDMIQGNDFGWKHRLARHFVPSWLDSLIVHSPSVREWYQERFGKGLIMPILADESRVRTELEKVLPLSEELRLGTKPLVGFVGRLVDLKNVPSLIHAFEPLKERAQLVIIGQGPAYATLKSMAPEAFFTGYLEGDSLLAWYNLIDVLVLPSLHEAYGAVISEALLAGAKAVVSSRAGSKDLVREGVNGSIVDPMDTEGLTARIAAILDGIPDNRPLLLRENLHPYRFAECMESLLEEINLL